MKTIGIVGGIGPESTIDYYRLLIAAGHTQIIINNVAVERLVGMMSRGETAGVAEYSSDAVETLAKAGADVGIIAANTPHIAFDEVQARSRIPMVSIVEAVADHVQAAGMKKVGLLGTRFTMQGTFYPDVFTPRGLSLTTPAPDDVGMCMESSSESSCTTSSARDTSRCPARHRAHDTRPCHRSGDSRRDRTADPAPSRAHDGVPLLDTTKIHAAAVLLAAGPLSN